MLFLKAAQNSQKMLVLSIKKPCQLPNQRGFNLTNIQLGVHGQGMTDKEKP